MGQAHLRNLKMGCLLRDILQGNQACLLLLLCIRVRISNPSNRECHRRCMLANRCSILVCRRLHPDTTNSILEHLLATILA